MVNVTLPFSDAINISSADALNTTREIANASIGIVHKVAEGITGFVPVGFAFGFENLLQIIVVHFVLLFIFHRVLGFFKMIIIAGVASAVLPFALVKIFGVSIPLTLSTIITFAIFGIAIYIVLALVWHVVSRRLDR
jgi:hypothetical protein